MYAEAIHQAILATYLQPMQQILDRRVRYYLALNAKDPFDMSEEESKKWQQRIQEIGQEIETLENVRSAIGDLHKTYHERLSATENENRELRHLLYQVSLDYITFRQMFETEAKCTAILLQHSIQTIQKSKAA